MGGALKLGRCRCMPQGAAGWRRRRGRWRRVEAVLWELELAIVREAFAGRGEDAPADPGEEDEW